MNFIRKFQTFTKQLPSPKKPRANKARKEMHQNHDELNSLPRQSKRKRASARILRENKRSTENSQVVSQKCRRMK